ncbi:uncharacterized protein LOC142526060 [Primulina tabacum]|uniref:uncharacterized protein LOC142526060 n=1 Tax=Primulina tabacum TaxID=48773 RepID=UPI003F5979EF
MNIPHSTQELEKKHSNRCSSQVRDNDGYTRLVITNEIRIPEAKTFESQTHSRKKSLIWLIKAVVWCSILIIIFLVFLKWGMPFLIQKVLFPILRWESTAFGRPVFALVLVASLALFPVFLIPSGPSMWLAGMIFGYGFGFVIIMVGTSIGMMLPYLIGLLFRDRIHVRNSQIPHLFLGISPFPYTIFNYVVVSWDVEDMERIGGRFSFIQTYWSSRHKLEKGFCAWIEDSKISGRRSLHFRRA